MTENLAGTIKKIKNAPHEPIYHRHLYLSDRNVLIVANADALLEAAEEHIALQGECTTLRQRIAELETQLKALTPEPPKLPEPVIYNSQGPAPKQYLREGD